MKNHWLRKHEEKHEEFMQMLSRQGLLTRYRRDKSVMKFRGKFQEADPVNWGGRIYPSPGNYIIGTDNSNDTDK